MGTITDKLEDGIPKGIRFPFNKKKGLMILVLFLAMMISFFGISRMVSDPAFHRKTIQSLDEKKMTVAELTAASTGAAAAITLLPGDAGTPIAEKMVDLSGYFVIILSAIYLEKVMTTVTGYLAFKAIIPIGLLILGIGILLEREKIRLAALRIMVLGVILFMLVPASVSISNMIEKTHEYSVQQTIDEDNAASEEIKNHSDEEDSNVLDQFINKVKNGVSGELEKFQALLSAFIDSIAMLIVTTCIIPIAVFLLLVFLVKQLPGLGRDSGRPS